MTTPIGLRIDDPRFWDAADLREEVNRVFDICHSCRLCFKFCGSFPRLFEMIDQRSAENVQEHLVAHPELALEAARRRALAEAVVVKPSDERHEVAETFGDELPGLAARAADLDGAEIDEVVELCFQCKLCDPACPYTPPHPWGIDVPRLFLRWKAQRLREGRRGRRLLALLRDPVRIGRWASLAPRFAGRAQRSGPVRWLMEHLEGIDARKHLPAPARENFPRWWRRRRAERSTAKAPGSARGSELVAASSTAPHDAPGAGSIAVRATVPGDTESAARRTPVNLPGRVVLFSTCTVDWNTPVTGRAAVAVLEHNGIEVVWPAAQLCCGMPRLDGGDVEGAARAVAHNTAVLLPWVERGYAVVVPSPSCSLMLREEAPQLVASPAARAVATATRDLCDYVAALGRAGRIDRTFSQRFGRVAYHVPCHIREQQIGFRGRDILKWFCEGVDLVQECSGHDGTWSMLREHFADSLAVGLRAADAMAQASSAGCGASCTDCPLAALQMHQIAGIRPVHPIVMMARAYGLDVGDERGELFPAVGPGE